MKLSKKRKNEVLAIVPVIFLGIVLFLLYSRPDDRILMVKTYWSQLKSDPWNLRNWGNLHGAIINLWEISTPLVTIFVLSWIFLYKKYVSKKWINADFLMAPLFLGVILLFLHWASLYTYHEVASRRVLVFYTILSFMGLSALIYSTLSVLIERMMSIKQFLLYSIILTFEIILFFSFIYFTLTKQHEYGNLVAIEILKNPIGIEVESLPTSIYYSVATYFSLGYGDICPTGWVRLISMLEVSIGYFMTIFIVSMGVTKYGLEKGELRRT